jgi:hypothetical protein
MHSKSIEQVGTLSVSIMYTIYEDYSAFIDIIIYLDQHSLSKI